MTKYTLIREKPANGGSVSYVVLAAEREVLERRRLAVEFPDVTC
jgi:hypothetical protein